MNNLLKTFIELTQILSPSQNEREISKYIIKRLKKYASDIIIDKSNKYTKSNTGNLIIKTKYTKATKPFLLSAHMDTVFTDKKPKINIKNKIISTSNSTILGADCKAGIAIIIEVVSELFKYKNIPPLELVFTTCEELGLAGSKNLDKNILRSKYGIVIDNEKEIDKVVAESVGVDTFEIIIKGISAHSGVNPEKGISAIKILADIISKIKIGRISKNTTMNIGLIEGGNGINIIAENAKAVGEIRSFKKEEIKKQEQLINKIINKTIPEYKNGYSAPEYNFKTNEKFSAFKINDNFLLKLIDDSYKRNNIKVNFTKSFGGTDANNFFKSKIMTANIPCGMRNVHSEKEFLLIDDFIKSKNIVMDIIKKYSDL